MNIASAYIDLVRPKNLAIIALTQWVLYSKILLPFVPNLSLDYFHFLLLVFVTICISGSGFIINDIFDHSFDILNKPQKSYIPDLISVDQAWIYYFLVLFIGAVVAVYLAFYINNIPLFLLYPSAVLLLFLYSKYWKNSVLVGNIVVSLFIAFVAGIVWFAERNAWSAMDNAPKKSMVAEIFLVYMIFSFGVNLIREIIKDMEDESGDRAANLKTLPIVYGDKSTRKVVRLLAAMMIVAILIWLGFSPLNNLHVGMYFLIFIVSPLVWVIYHLADKQPKSIISKISNTLKWVLIAGLGGIFIITGYNG